MPTATVLTRTGKKTIERSRFRTRRLEVSSGGQRQADDHLQATRDHGVDERVAHAVR